MKWRFPPQVPNNVPVSLDKFTVVHDTNLIRLQNLLLDELTQQGPDYTVCNRFETNFVENLYKFGFVVMATHGTPTIVRVPCADALTMKNVPTRKGP
jgi:hypothetical protein